MTKEDFYDFEDALERLGLEKEELKRLVSEGEIRAFRDGEGMRLRKEDVESLRRGLDEGAFLDEDSEDITEELVFEEDGLGDDIGMSTAKISEEETLLEDDITLDDLSDLDDLGDEFELPADEQSGRRASGGGAVRRSRSRHQQLQEEEEAKQGPIFAVISVLSALILLFGVAAGIAIASGQPNQVTSWVAGLGETFLGEDAPKDLPTDFEAAK